MTVGIFRASGPARARAALALTLVSALVAGLALLTPGARASGAAGTVAFVGDRDGDPEIFTVTPEGTGLQQITANTAWDTDPAWSPDAAKIAFSSTRDGDDDIYVMTATADSTPVNVTDAGSGRDVQPDWSPDSSKIAFARDGDVYVVATSGGSAPVRLGRGTSPSWRPDGGKIAVIRRAQGSTDVWLVNPDGSGAAALTSGLDADAPDWSPDGSKIAVESTAGPTGDSRIVVLDADGTNPIELPGPGEDFTPSWSPDGSSLVFTNITLDADLVVATLDGSRRDLVAGSSYDFLPAWSPCPPGSCPAPTPTGTATPTASPTGGPIDERAATTITLSFQKGRRIKVAGAVDPVPLGARVRVILWKKKAGQWVRVARKRPLLDDEGLYRTRFMNPARTRRCRLRARFPGDADHLPSRRTKRFRC